jgi:glycosyltransferase involved in cell wall biosynthesis
MVKTSFILSFYNRLDYLRLIFAGLERQTFTDFEVIIADDGSDINLVNQIEQLSLNYSFPVKHLWQEDKGFRKNKIYNKAILAASSNHIIFIDGDCVPHSRFIAEHYDARREGVCYTGRRVNLSAKITALLNEKNIRKGYLENKNLVLIADGLFGNSMDVEKGFYINNKIIRGIVNRKKRGILGCNFSVCKEDILKINGFDERYEAPSIGEDSDIQFRLELAGVKIKSLNNAAVQYHLYHKLQERPIENLTLFTEVKKSGISFTPFGIKNI